MTAGAFFPSLPERAWQEHRDALVPGHLGAGDGMVQVAMQTWLPRSEGRTILVDTGVGNDRTRPAVPVGPAGFAAFAGLPAGDGVRGRRRVRRRVEPRAAV